MNKIQSKFIKLDIKYELLDSHLRRDMFAINAHMDQILELFGEDIVWDNLHNVDRGSRMFKLQQIIKHVRGVASVSNQHANKLAND